MIKTLLAALVSVFAVTTGGCAPSWPAATTQPAKQTLPAPYDVLLPREIRIHPFTGTVFHESAHLGQPAVTGFDVRVEALDGYGDASKAFGNFRFELYRYQPGQADPRGRRIAVWVENLNEKKKNLLHWDKLARSYQFRLELERSLHIGHRYVLLVTFDSPYTDRLFARRIFTAGE